MAEHDVMTIHDVPIRFLCPITHEVMQEPLTSRYGQSFERSAILTWLQRHDGTCPLTRKQLNVTDLIRDRRLQLEIQNWHKARGIPFVVRGNKVRNEYGDEVECDNTSMIVLTYTKDAVIDFYGKTKTMKKHQKKKNKENMMNQPRNQEQEVQGDHGQVPSTSSSELRVRHPRTNKILHFIGLQ